MSDDDQSGNDKPGNDRNDEPAGGPPRGALAALLVVAVLIGAFMFVMHRLTEAGRLQDCVASGRTNCAPIDTQQK
jgi:hypothetical protein